MDEVILDILVGAIISLELFWISTAIYIYCV